MELVIIGNILSMTITPIAVFIFFRCFYDDSIRMTGSEILRFLLPEALTVTIMELSAFTDVIDFLPFSGELAALVHLVIPVVIFCDRNRHLRYYLKNLLVTAVLNAFFRMTVSAFVICVNMILVRTGIITADSYDILYELLKLFSLLMIILWLYVEFLRKHLTIPMRKKDTFLFGLYFVFVILIFWSNNYNHEYSWDEPWIFFVSVKLFMLLLLILIPVILMKNRQSAYHNELSIRNAQFLEMELDASHTYRQSQEDTRAFRHDMNNHFLVISSMMQKKQYHDAESYLHSLSETLSSFSPRVVTGDAMLDSLFDSKLSVMEEKSIPFEISGVIDGGLDWKPIDICAVFANLIDNAIEACDKVTAQNRYIKVSIRKNNLQYMITFQNSVAQSVDCAMFQENLQYTSKPDKNRHGFGMKNIRHTLAKYGAVMQISCTDTEFTTKIIVIK